MEPRVEENSQRSYETLPDLLKDFHELARSCQRRYEARIDCGGDFHNLSFYSATQSASPFLSCGGGLSRDRQTDGTASQTYDSLEALMAELNHIREYVAAHEEDLGRVRLEYYVSANGGHPVLRVYCAGNRNMPEYDDAGDCPAESFICRPVERDASCYYRSLMMQGLSIMSVSLLSAAPVLLLVKYLNIRN